MIIDADCHLSSDSRWGMTADTLIHDMDRAGVHKALVWLKPPYNKDIGPENEAVYQATQQYPERFFGFGWVNPRLGLAQATQTLRQCFEKYHFCGVKFNGAQDDYVIDDRATLEIIALAASYGKPLAFHIGADFYENTHPYRLGAIAGRFPDTTFLMIHMGGTGLPDLSRAAIETAQRHDNISIIASNVSEMAILKAMMTLGPKRICFGSDSPFRLMHVQLAMFKALLRDESQAVQDAILGANILNILRA